MEGRGGGLEVEGAGDNLGPTSNVRPSSGPKPSCKPQSNFSLTELKSLNLYAHSLYIQEVYTYIFTNITQEVSTSKHPKDFNLYNNYE